MVKSRMKHEQINGSSSSGLVHGASSSETGGKWSSVDREKAERESRGGTLAGFLFSKCEN